MAEFEGNMNLNVKTSEIEVNGKFKLTEDELDIVAGGGATCPDQLAIPPDEVYVGLDVWALDTTNHLFRWGKVVFIDEEGLVKVEFGGGNVLTSEGVKSLQPNYSWNHNLWGAPF